MKVRGSYIWALFILLAIGGWLASGILPGESETGAPQKPKPAGNTAEVIPAVRVATLAASNRKSDLIARGRTEAVRRVEVRAEIPGRIVATPVRKGAVAKTGAVLCEIDMADREAVLAQARAGLEQRDLDYRAATKLSKRGFASRTKEAADRARYNGALAAVERAKLAVERTRIRAPFTGIVEEQPAKVGAYVGIGDTCATLVEMQPILVVAQVSERQIGQLTVGMQGRAKLIGGAPLAGKIRYIASVADPATRTFRVELVVANRDLAIRAGTTAEIYLPLVDVLAHRISPAILSLNDDGVVGVRTLGDDDRVRFVPVEIIGDGIDGVWVTGLPSQVRIITVGQEYVSDGQQVRPTLVTAQEPRAPAR